MAKELMLRVRLRWVQDEVRKAGNEREGGAKGEAARHAEGLVVRMEEELKAYDGVEYVYAPLPWEIPLSSRKTKRKRRQTDADDGDELMDPTSTLSPPSHPTPNGQPSQTDTADEAADDEDEEEEEEEEKEERLHVGRGRRRAVVDDSDYEEEEGRQRPLRPTTTTLWRSTRGWSRRILARLPPRGGGRCRRG